MIEIVAEAGLNHGGSLFTALRMIDAAVLARVNVVKFQTYDPDKLLRSNDSERQLLTSLALSRPEFIKLARYCEEIGIEFLSTPGDIDSLKFLAHEVGVRRIKIGSDDLTNYLLIEAAARTDLPLIFSTGMATLGEIHDAVSIVWPDTQPVTLLHCVSAYPCPYSDANLQAIVTLANEFEVSEVGYSDHTEGTVACIAAATLGAKMIEKHFMLERHSVCVDKAVSITTVELTKLVEDIRNVERCLGTGAKHPMPSEIPNIAKFRKGADGKRGVVCQP